MTSLEDAAVWRLTQLVTGLPFVLPRAEAVAGRAAVRRLLDAVRDSPDYAGLPRVGGRMLAGTLLNRPDIGHAYTYTPPRVPAGGLGGLVFLHGHGGNTPLLLHALRPLADRAGLAVVAPSFGVGNWEDARSLAVIDRAVTQLPAAVDRGRVVVMGLSQGGAGVGRAGRRWPGRFAGHVFVSPTLEVRVLAGWRGGRALVVNGGADRNVWPPTVDRGVQALRGAGASVTDVRVPGAGHLLFFARLGWLTDVIGGWLTRRP